MKFVETDWLYRCLVRGTPRRTIHAYLCFHAADVAIMLK